MVAAGHVHSVRDVLLHLILIQCSQMVAHRDALPELDQARVLELPFQLDDYGLLAGVEQAFHEFFEDKPEEIIDQPTTQCMIVKL